MNPFSAIITIFNTLFIDPIINITVLFIHAFNAIGISGSLGFSIIALTAVIKILIWPLMSGQIRSARKMADLKPHLDKLKEKHKGDQQKFSQAQMALFKEHGYNPLSGCLPALIQMPIFIALYQVIFAFFDIKSGLNRINDSTYSFIPDLTKIPSPQFLGIDLSHKPSDFGQYGWALLLVPLITASLQFVQSKMMAPAPVRKYPSDSPKEKKEKNVKGDMSTAMQNQILYLMPLMIGFFAYGFPMGLALYWNTFTIFGIIQQYKIAGLGGLSEWIKKK
ncbi:MAG: membrane protein insertase YidC [Candidatus Levybacteria bacterium]|nr:membrane protein insertase YidC [Candidatus Levybacteria bacterium]